VRTPEVLCTAPDFVHGSISSSSSIARVQDVDFKNMACILFPSLCSPDHRRRMLRGNGFKWIHPIFNGPCQQHTWSADNAGTMGCVVVVGTLLPQAFSPCQTDSKLWLFHVNAGCCGQWNASLGLVAILQWCRSPVMQELDPVKCDLRFIFFLAKKVVPPC